MHTTKFNLNDTQLFKLTGLYDILSEEELKTIKPKKTEGTDYIRLQVSCSEIDLLVLMIYPTIKLIYVDVILGSGQTEGIGKLWLKSIVKRATRSRYRFIELSAHRNDSHILRYNGKEYKWNGYFVWGKVGYLMIDTKEILHFSQIVNNHKRNDKLLYQMLKDKEGKEIWSIEGFTWYGQFDLKAKSLSKTILYEK